MPNRSKFNSNEEYNAWFREYRRKRIDRHRKYQRDYMQDWRMQYGYAANERWQSKNPEKVEAQRILKNAMRRGLIAREPCVKCGNGRSVAHHPDYTKPLEVVFLCHAHHREYHYRVAKPVI